MKSKQAKRDKKVKAAEIKDGAPLQSMAAATEQKKKDESAGPGKYRLHFFVAAIVLTGILIYSNSFDCSFHFDDSNVFQNSVIYESASIHDWIKLFPARPLGVLTFALNYHFHKQNVWGYHFVNLSIHLANALLVFWLSLLTFATPVVKDTAVNRHRTWIAFFTAMLFVSHPLATQSVTYIVQRFASLATFFYLLSVALYVRGRIWNGKNGVQWFFYGGAVVSAVLSMLTKEIAFTLPFALVLYEYCFMKTDTWKFDSGRMKGLAVSVLVFIIFVAMFFRAYSFKVFNAVPPDQGYSYSISAKEYLFTQFNVIVTYLRLFVLPINQTVDYDYPVSHSLFDGYTFFSLMFLLAIAALGAWAFKRWRLIAFGIFWFFLSLAVESSILPVSQNVIFEHRTYLPSFGFFLAATSVFFYFTKDHYKKFVVGVLIVLVGAGSVLAYQRNRIWKNDETFFVDNYMKAPNKPRPMNWYGKVLVDRGDLRGAVRLYERAIQINPAYDVSYHNLGRTKAALNDYAGAIADYTMAIKLNRKDASAYYNRAYARTELKDYQGAIADYEAVLRIDPYGTDAYCNLGNLKAEFMKDYAGSIQMFNKAIEIDRKNGMAYGNRGNSKYMLRDIQGACNDWKIAASLGISRVMPAIQSVCR